MSEIGSSGQGKISPRQKKKTKMGTRDTGSVPLPCSYANTWDKVAANPWVSKTVY